MMYEPDLLDIQHAVCHSSPDSKNGEEVGMPALFLPFIYNRVGSEYVGGMRKRDIDRRREVEDGCSFVNLKLNTMTKKRKREKVYQIIAYSNTETEGS